MKREIVGASMLEVQKQMGKVEDTGFTPLVHVHCLAMLGADILDRMDGVPTTPGHGRDHALALLVEEFTRSYHRRVEFLNTVSGLKRASD